MFLIWNAISSKKLQFLTCVSLQIDLITIKIRIFIKKKKQVLEEDRNYRIEKIPPNYLCTQKKHAYIEERKLGVYLYNIF